MGMHISKIMLALAGLFFIAVLITTRPLFFGDTVNTLRLALYSASAGLFLGLYRIIDLLEKK